MLPIVWFPTIIKLLLLTQIKIVPTNPILAERKSQQQSYDKTFVTRLLRLQFTVGYYTSTFELLGHAEFLILT